MSVKKEANGRRSVQVEVEVPGTPEQVWQAIATGPGVGAWFVPSEIDGRVGGTVTSHFGGGMDSAAAITKWDAPHSFAAQSAWGDSAMIATEWVVEARDGGTCVVRVVHSLFAETDEWDNQLEGTESGWPSFFLILRLYLAHFAGQPSSYMQLLAMPAANGGAWEKLAGGLNLLGATPGDRRSAGAGLPPLGGIVETSVGGTHPHLLLRTETPGPGAVLLNVCPAGDKEFVSVSFYLYGDTAPATVARDESAWQAFMSSLFPA
ncbi:MAG: SRPBCC domain-containing protein [Candidatus Solibacter sp.]